MLLSENGEDRIFLCGACDYAVNAELTTDVKICPSCGGEIKEARAIEIAHIFYLGDLYSKKMSANFTDKDGKQKPFIMGCYGIGIPRLMAAIVEASHDEKGIIWPESVSPYKITLIDLTNSNAEKIYDELIKAGIEVLSDNGKLIPLKRIGLDLKGGYCYKYGGRENIQMLCGLDKNSLVKKILELR